MPLNLPSVTAPVSNVLGDYLPTHASKACSLVDARTIVEYLATFPGLKFDLAIVAYPNFGNGSPVDEKFLQDNCKDKTKPLSLTLEGTVTIPQKSPGFNTPDSSVIYPIKDYAANIGNTLNAKQELPGLVAFLYTFGVSSAQIDAYCLTLPEVKKLIDSYLREF